MNRIYRVFNRNRTQNMDRETAPTPPAVPAAPTHSSRPPTQSWTTHDSNLALLKCLSTATPTRPALPVELILQVLEHPTRWVHLLSVHHPPATDPERPILKVYSRSGGAPAKAPVLYTRPLSAREAKLVRKVVFTFRSRDQGWCGNPNGGCWSWFEVGLARIPSSVEEGDDGPGQMSDAAVWTGSYEWVGEWMGRHGEDLEGQPRYRILGNKIGEIEPEDHVVELMHDHESMQRVQEGDRIILWACALFPGWENRVYEAEVAILGIDDKPMEREKNVE